MRIILASSYREVPWKNGGGTTREIADSGEMPPLWRLSLATIDRDGPFSDFTGYDRTIIPISGDGIALAINGGSSQALAHLQPFFFAGEDTIECRLVGGTTHDLNVLTRRDRYRHHVEVFRTIRKPMHLAGGIASFAYILEGPRAGDTLVGEGGAFTVDPALATAALYVRIEAA
jgi:environmental stress-induced protein Ves